MNAKQNQLRQPSGSTRPTPTGHPYASTHQIHTVNPLQTLKDPSKAHSRPYLYSSRSLPIHVPLPSSNISNSASTPSTRNPSLRGKGGAGTSDTQGGTPPSVLSGLTVVVDMPRGRLSMSTALTPAPLDLPYNFPRTTLPPVTSAGTHDRIDTFTLAANNVGRSSPDVLQ